MIGLAVTYVRKIASCSSSSNHRCRTPNVADLRKADTTGSLTAINRARADGTECLRERSSLHKADRLYCSIWPTR